MMKLLRPPEPEELKINKNALTQEYAADCTKAVWRKDYIVESLYKSSNKKCAYCGTLVRWDKGEHSYFIEIDEDKQFNTSPGENDFLHIDHFYAKKYAKDKVVEWDNLIPSCPKCNYKKGSHDVFNFPIINPYEDDPRQYFTFCNNMLRIKIDIENVMREKANKTIAVFQFVFRLLDVLSPLNKAVEENLFKIFTNLEESISQYKKGDSGPLNESIQQLINQLSSGLPTSRYGAFIATQIINHPYFEAVKKQLTESGLWSDELSKLENQLKEIAYE